MASILSSLNSIPNLAVPPKTFPKHPQQISLFPLPLLSLHFNSRTVSSSNGGSSPALHAVQQEVIQSTSSESTNDSEISPSSSSKLVLVIGGTGGVGQLVVASLLNRNIKSRLLLRDPEKATKLFGEQDEEKMQVFKGDTRNKEDLDPSIFEGVTHLICCTGTTAFPSKRWEGDNTPERVDWEGVRNLVSALPLSLQRVVLVSSVGVTKFNELPWRVIADADCSSDQDITLLLRILALSSSDQEIIHGLILRVRREQARPTLIPGDLGRILSSVL